MERQIHGFNFEKEIIEMWGMEETNYRDEWDAYYKGIPVSIKYRKLGNNVEMSSIFKNANKKENYLLIVGFWKYNKKRKKELIETHYLYINKNFWNSNFKQETLDKLKNVFKGISNDRCDDSKWRVRMSEYNKIWDSDETIIKAHFKRDHKKQKRIQCSIKIKYFYEILVRHYSVDLDDFEITKI